MADRDREEMGVGDSERVDRCAADDFHIHHGHSSCERQLFNVEMRFSNGLRLGVFFEPMWMFFHESSL